MSTDMLAFSRRRFLAMAGWLMGACGIPLPARAQADAKASRMAATRLVQALGAHSSRRLIGTAYLRRHANEHTTSALIGGLVRAHPSIGAVMDSDDRDGLRSVLRQSVKRDFRHGDTTIVAGWLLSRTEARLCALVALRKA